MTPTNDPKLGSSKGLSGKDVELWREVTQHDNVLPGRGYSVVGKAPSAPRRKQPGTGQIVGTTSDSKISHKDVPEAQVGAGLDKRTAQKLRRGQIPIDRRLDLHGLTQSEAHTALGAALEGAQACGHRCLLVITGKGAGRESGGVLKTMVPRWLDEPVNRARVFAIQAARRQHGGAGAVYVLLRKQR